MCFDFLAQLSRSKAPVTFATTDEINRLMVLRAAGLVAAFTLRTRENDQVREWGRFLALTPEGRAALALRLEKREA